MNENREKILSVKNLKISFRTDSGLVHAVRGVSFDLYKGETLCIVGESGSGKSVTNKAIMGISANNAIIESGQILYEGEDLVRVSEEEFHRIRGHKIGMIFQDPLSSLNPIMKVGKQITEATLINRNIIKRTYSEYFLRELIQYRNANANKVYEQSFYREIITNAKNLIKKFNDKKLDDESKKDLANQIHDFISTEYRVINDNLNKYKNDLLKYEKELSELTENVFERKTILEKKISLIGKKIDLATDFLSNKRDSTDFLVTLDEIISYYENKKKQSKEYFTALKGTYKKALSESKKVAKKKIKIYKSDLDNKYHLDLSTLETELKEVDDKISGFILKASDDIKNNYEQLLETYKRLAKAKKKAEINKDINLSKLTKSETNIIKSTGNETLDSLLKEKEKIEYKIEAVKEEYVSKTKITRAQAKKMALEVMREVGIPMPERRFKQYPFEFSGGMRQRIVIAIALTANPDILICDEPTTALDVTIQAQILELINKLKKERNLSCIFITHDLGVVANMADRVAVMYAGKIVEYGKVDEIFYNPKHPYTWALLSSIPDVDSKEKLDAIPGTPPDMRFPPKGDAFALRSKYALAIDFKYEPPFFKVSDTHYAATWLLYPGAPKVEMPKIVKTRIENSLKGHPEIKFQDNEEVK